MPNNVEKLLQGIGGKGQGLGSVFDFRGRGLSVDLCEEIGIHHVEDQRCRLGVAASTLACFPVPFCLLSLRPHLIKNAPFARGVELIF